MLTPFNQSLKYKNSLFFILFTVFAFQIRAQNTRSIRGVIVDNSLPVEFASVILSTVKDSSKVISVTATDSLGRFELKDVPVDKYLLKIQMIGFTTQRAIIESNSFNGPMDLGIIQLISDGKLLQGVDVVSHRDLIKKTPQGFIINAKDNLTQASGTATDLLRNTPTVVVDPDGAITVRGKSPLVLVNGRNSILGATDRIPASSVESIEIINNPSAQYDADAEGGIINITLKKNTAKGTNGSVALGGGYGAKGRANSSFIINSQKGKWNFGLAYDNRFADRRRNITANRTSFDMPSDYYLIQKRYDTKFEQAQNLKLNIDFSPNEKNSFNFEAIGNMTGQDNDETLTSLFTTQNDSFTSKNLRRSLEIGRENVAELALNYKKKFDDKRRKLSANISSSFNFETENTKINTHSLSVNDAVLGSDYLQKTSNTQPANVSNFKIDYAHPITKKGILEMGYKGITRFTNADFKSQYVQNNDYVNNPTSSNVFNYKEQVHAAYFQYKSYIGKEDSAKWKYDIGLRAEQVWRDGKSLTNNITVNKPYFNIFPSANIAYYITENDFLKLSFGRRINRPRLEQINPFTDITDSLNPHAGNPYLMPELINSVEGGYNKEWKNVSLSTTLFYRYSTNIIQQYFFLQNNGVVLRKPMNFGTSITYGVEGILSIFPTKFWSANASVSFYQQNINGSNVSSDVSNNLFCWYAKVINNFALWKGSKMQLITNYTAPVTTPQGYKIAVYYADFGFQQKILNNRGGIGLVITDVLNTQYSGEVSSASNFKNSRISKLDTRAVLLTFAYSFRTSFKEEMVENKFSND